MDDFFYSSTPPFTAFMVNLYMQSTSQEVAGKDLEENEFAPGRQAVVSIAGDQLIVQDSAHPADRLYVASSETLFLSSVSMASVEFVKNAQGVITLVRHEANKSERAAKISR